MAQSTDLVVPNTTAAGVRSGLNTRLQAIATHQSGATAPVTTYPYQFWADTTAGLLKQRDGANSAWVTVGTLGTANLGLATVASPALTGTPTAPTATAGTNTTQIATTAFVATATADARPVRMTAQASTSGTSIDFSGIPSWARRVTVMLESVSTTGSSAIQIQLGTAASGGTFATTGYNSGTFVILGTDTCATQTNSSGFAIIGASPPEARFGSIAFTNISGNSWVANGSFLNGSSGYIGGTAGMIALGAVLDRVRITTVGGTDTFDGGTINIIYE